MDKLIRAYELLKSTDMSVAEVARALELDHQLLERAIDKAEQKGVYLK